MKKQLLALALLTAGMANAQTWSEDFNAATTPGLPAGWLQNNVDGRTVVSNLSAFAFGTNAWVTYNAATDFPTYGKVVASTSWYNPAGAANDWLITPSFTVPANGVLEWDGLAPNASFQDGYSVKISVTGTLTTDFSTNLLTVPAENASWTNRALSLNTYSNQVVRIAFVNASNDMDKLYLDNIKVIVPANSDGNVVSVTGTNRYMVTGNQTIAGVFKSKGLNPVNNATLNYRINSGAVVTQTITFGTALNYGGTANYSFTTPAAMPVGTNKIKVWVTQVNGVAETNLVNDSAAVNTIYTASQAPQRNVLIEEFTSSTCGPCASLNVSFDPLLNGNNPNTGGRVNVIKNQVNWPAPGNDPSYNSHSAARVTFYGVNAAPTTIVNGTTEMNAHNQTEIDNGKAEPAYALISSSLSVSSNSAVITGSASVTPYVTISANSPLVIHQVLLQSSYNFPAAVTSQKNYFHVMRKMYPSAVGTTVTPVDGTAINVSFTHTATVTGLVGTPAQGSYDFWDATNIVYEYVVFLQDKVSGDVLQSSSSKINGPVGVVELKDNQKIGIYPNPAKDFAVVGISVDQSTNASIEIYDITGKLVYSNASVKVEAGQHEMKINTSDFATGTYNVIVNTDLGILKDKLIIVK